MASNSFGTLFRITTFGESHGTGVGCVIDGCPSGVVLSEADIQPDLERRSPGRKEGVSSRDEPDVVKILSGVYEGMTTGAPIAMWIANVDVDSSAYNSGLFRPGHADLTYFQKYGHVDHRGGGRASARETAARVAAGAVAKKMLHPFGICFSAWLSRIGSIVLPRTCSEEENAQIEDCLRVMKEEGDSIGGIVSCCIEHLPSGLGDPMYEKLSSKLAFAMLSIPASRGFEIGEGFAAAQMKGSEHNDPLFVREGDVISGTNHAGGTLGGISTGMPIFFRVAFKPTSSIQKAIPTATKDKKQITYSTPPDARHDQCVAVRAVCVVEAMAALVLADAWLMRKVSRA
jgi:chorismate synthase